MSAPVPGYELVGDVSDLPRAEFGARSLLWWGTFGFMLIEATGFVLAAAVYLYLRGQAPVWPPRGDVLPGLLWSGVFTAGLIASVLPNLWVEAQARKRRAAGVRWGVVVMSVAGLALLGVRALELAHLNVRWDHDAYGSVVWLLMFLHTTHVVTDLGDTLVLGAWLFTHEIGDQQFSDVCDNGSYWNFVIVSWLPIYFLVYWFARIT